MDAAGGGKQLYITGNDVSHVPEPAAIILLSAGLLGLVGTSRRKLNR